MRTRKSFRQAVVGACAAALALGLAACGSSGSSAGSGSGTKSASNPYHLLTPGTLTVGMDLQFKPEMYLDASGKPAGYDVALLNKLASSMHVKLDIQNLDFNGLIPGLQAHKFDLVSVGLSPTPEREQAVSFTRAYVPYALILAVPKDSKIPATIAAWNSSSRTLTALQGSTDAQLAQKTFAHAKLDTFSDDTTALLQVATHRADGAVVGDYILSQYSKANPGQLDQEAFKQPLNVQYGSYAVAKGNTAFVSYLNTWLCTEQTSGFLASAYKSTEGVSDFPPMPSCS